MAQAHAQLVQVGEADGGAEQAQGDFLLLAVEDRHGGGADFNRRAANVEGNFAVLGQTLLGDVHASAHLEMQHDVGAVLLGHPFEERGVDAVDGESYPVIAGLGLDQDVRRAAFVSRKESRLGDRFDFYGLRVKLFVGELRGIDAVHDIVGKVLLLLDVFGQLNRLVDLFLEEVIEVPLQDGKQLHRQALPADLFGHGFDVIEVVPVQHVAQLHQPVVFKQDDRFDGFEGSGGGPFGFLRHVDDVQRDAGLALDLAGEPVFPLRRGS